MDRSCSTCSIYQKVDITFAFEQGKPAVPVSATWYGDTIPIFGPYEHATGLTGVVTVDADRAPGQATIASSRTCCARCGAVRGSICRGMSEVPTSEIGADACRCV